MTKLAETARAYIVGSKQTHTAEQLAAMFGVERADICRVWFRHAAGYRTVPAEIVKKSSSFKFSPGVNYGIKPATAVPDDPIVDHGVTLMELESCHCRWPIGRDQDNQVRYCGENRAAKVMKEVRMYCEAHGKRALERTADIHEDEKPIVFRRPSPWGFHFERQKSPDLVTDTFFYEIGLKPEENFSSTMRRATASGKKTGHQWPNISL